MGQHCGWIGVVFGVSNIEVNCGRGGCGVPPVRVVRDYRDLHGCTKASCVPPSVRDWKGYTAVLCDASIDRSKASFGRQQFAKRLRGAWSRGRVFRKDSIDPLQLRGSLGLALAGGR